MEKFKERTSIIIGDQALERLDRSRVIVFGLGGVGSYVVEALARAGVGHLTLVDFDDVDATNINRQLPALHSTIGSKKVDVVLERVRDINPEIDVRGYVSLYDETTSDRLLEGHYDYVVDAIDMVKSKIHLIDTCYKRGLKIISSMGMGNKLDPCQIEVSDIHKTEMCPLAKLVRKEAKQRGIKKLTVVYSKEKPSQPRLVEVDGRQERINGSISFVPSAGGLVIASYVVRDLLGLIYK